MPASDLLDAAREALRCCHERCLLICEDCAESLHAAISAEEARRAAEPELVRELSLALRDLLRDEAVLDDDDPRLNVTRDRALAALARVEGRT